MERYTDPGEEEIANRRSQFLKEKEAKDNREASQFKKKFENNDFQNIVDRA